MSVSKVLERVAPSDAARITCSSRATCACRRERSSRHSVTARCRPRAVSISPSFTVLAITSAAETLCTCICEVACGAVVRSAPHGVGGGAAAIGAEHELHVAEELRKDVVRRLDAAQQLEHLGDGIVKCAASDAEEEAGEGLHSVALHVGRGRVVEACAALGEDPAHHRFAWAE